MLCARFYIRRSLITVSPMLSHAVTEKRVLMALIPTPVSAMLAILVQSVRWILMSAC